MMFSREDMTTTATMDKRRFSKLLLLLLLFFGSIHCAYLLITLQDFSVEGYNTDLFSLCQISFGNFALYLFLYARYSLKRAHVV